MLNIAIYLTTVLIWGTTWLAIKYQVADASPELSVFYRFLIASTLLIFYCKHKKMPLRFSLREHYELFLLGVCMFSIHLIFVYKASLYLVSGLVSVLFSTVCLFNIINSSLFLKTKSDRKMVAGALLGFLGTAVFFAEEVLTLKLRSATLLGVAYILAGALIFSFGNILSHRAKRTRDRLIPSTALAMLYGTCIVFVYILTQSSIHFVFPLSFSYWGGLLYLVFFGTLVGFLCYLNLISRMGPERAGYVTVFFPVVALVISIFYENYEMGLKDYLGVTLIFIGNCLVMMKRTVRDKALLNDEI